MKKRITAILILCCLLLATGAVDRRAAAADVQCPTCGSYDVTETQRKVEQCAGGRVDYICNVCGATINTTVPGEHPSFTEHVLVEPTCSTSGQAEYTCTACEGVYDGGYYTATLPRKPHSYKETVTKEPTCTSGGEKLLECTVCSAITTHAVPDDYRKTEIIPALGHDPVSQSRVEATCTEDGHESLKCSRCGVVEETVIPAAGHVFEETDTAPTCTEPGEKGLKCTVCGFLDGEAVPAMGHVFNQKTTGATCTEDGEEDDICTVCGFEQKTVLPATGHSFGEWITDLQPGFFSKGHRYKECSGCRFREEEDIPAKIPVWAYITAGAALAAAGIALALNARKKKKLAELKLPELSGRIVMCLLTGSDDNRELIKFLKSHRYIDTEFTGETEPEKIAEAVADAEPDIILLSVNDSIDPDAAASLMDTVSGTYEDAVFALIADDAVCGRYGKALDGMVKDGRIQVWLPSGTDHEEALTKIMLPLYKPELTFENTVSAIGSAADMLGIPFVSVITNAFIEGKNIKETIEEEDADAVSVASVIGSIASILGLETVGSVAGLVEDLDTIKSAVDRNSGVSEGADALEAGQDIADVVSDLLK